MKVLLYKTTKYKGKMIFPGEHDVTKTKAKEWEKLGIAKEVKEEPVVTVINPPQGGEGTGEGEGDELNLELEDENN